MKIVILGAGAVGGCFGGLLAKSGEDVIFVARGDYLKEILNKGLLLKILMYR